MTEALPEATHAERLTDALHRSGGLGRRRIEQRAFELWKSEGFPSGRDWAHWVQAETEILAELEATVALQNP